MLLRDIQDAELAWDIAQVVGRRGNARRMQVVQAGSRDVDQRRAKRMRIAQGALLRIGRLIALLESAAIRNTRKNSRNELRVIRQTESEEKLVFVAEIHVHARIKGISMLEELRRYRIVAEKRSRCRIRIQIQQFDGVRIQSSCRKNVKARLATVARVVRRVDRACAKGIPDEPGLRSNKPGHWIDLPCRYSTSGGGVENRASSEDAAQVVRLRSALRK